jgi:hypothetical protein
MLDERAAQMKLQLKERLSQRWEQLKLFMEGPIIKLHASDRASFIGKAVNTFSRDYVIQDTGAGWHLSSKVSDDVWWFASANDAIHYAKKLCYYRAYDMWRRSR